MKHQLNDTGFICDDATLMAKAFVKCYPNMFNDKNDINFWVRELSYAIRRHGLNVEKEIKEQLSGYDIKSKQP